MRSRELTGKGIASFQRAAKADGADKSGLTALTYATMANFASDAALAVALANTLFFSAAAGEDKIKVALYLLITIAPFGSVSEIEAKMASDGGGYYPTPWNERHQSVALKGSGRAGTATECDK